MATNKYRCLLQMAIICPLLYQSSAQTSIKNGMNSERYPLADNYNSFAMDLFHKVRQNIENESNFVLSPFPIWTLLLSYAEGATNSTLSEIRTTLKLKQDFKSIREEFEDFKNTLNLTAVPGEMTTSTVIFHDMNRHIKQVYKKISQNSYETAIIPVLYHMPKDAKYFINSYVATDSRGLIESSIDEHDLSEASLVLFSSTFFRGQWKFPFTKALRTWMFYDECACPQKFVYMLYAKGNFPTIFIDEVSTSVFEIPFGNDDKFSMIVFLPDYRNTVKMAIDYLFRVGISSIVSELENAAKRNPYHITQLFLPQFTTSSDLQLNTVLQEMGIVNAFDASKANFSQVSDDPLHISNIFHQTLIEVSNDSVPNANSIFRLHGQISNKFANHPFAYVILEKSTKSLLLCGQVTKPSVFTD